MLKHEELFEYWGVIGIKFGIKGENLILVICFNTQ